jgi:hypothetical protein
VAPVLRPSFVDTNVDLALVFGNEVSVVVVAKLEELKMVGMSGDSNEDWLDRIECVDDRDEAFEEAKTPAVDVDVIVAILWPC